jgi:hypothetical protein
MSDETTSEMTPQEQYEMLLNQLQNSINPMDFMTPGQREIAMLTELELESEYALVQAKKSNRGRVQRDLIIDRYEYELAKADMQKEKQ